MRKYFPKYEEAVSHIWLCNCSTLNFLIYEENLIFSFISVSPAGMSLTKLSLGENNLYHIIPAQGEFGKWQPDWGRENR